MAVSKRKLKVGDTVKWRGAWGSQPPVLVKVTDMERVKVGHKEDGTPIKSATWDEVQNKKTIVVILDNDHWAYGAQLSPK